MQGTNDTNKIRNETMKVLNTIPANGEKACGCCGRFHRKLVLSVTGHFVGTTCAKNIKTYMEKSSDIKSIFWIGYETQHSQVKKMLG